MLLCCLILVAGRRPAPLWLVRLSKKVESLRATSTSRVLLAINCYFTVLAIPRQTGPTPAKRLIPRSQLPSQFFIHVKPTRPSPPPPFVGSHRTTRIVDSDGSSAHTTPSLRGSTHDTVPGKTDVDTHYQIAAPPGAQSSASADSAPPPFSSHNFPSRYFPAPSPVDPYRALVTDPQPPASPAPTGPTPPFEESAASPSSVVAETKAALPRDTKERKDVDDGEPPPPYTDGSSPLDGFTYVMAAAGGAASILTQVQQGGPAPLNTAGLGGGELRPTMYVVHIADHC